MFLKIEPGNGAVIGAIIAAGISLISAFINIFIVISQSKKQRTAEIITSNRVEWMQKLKDYISEYLSKVRYFYDTTFPENLNEYFGDLGNITAKIELHLNFKGKQDKKIINIIQELNKSLETFLQLKKYNIYSNHEKKKFEGRKKLIQFYFYKDKDLEMTKKTLANVLIKNKIIFKSEKEFKQYIKDIVQKEDFGKLGFDICNELASYINNDIKKCVKKVKYSSQLIMLLTQVYLKTEWERVKVESKKGDASKFNFDEKYNEIKQTVKDKISELEKLVE
ncbi:hypothetical protein CLRAG_02380 [Clostridium ragsdalei P11]|uniref:Uncharacterized protein n=1 Tax=Clostridium ragsdalei P11 TaxID=1353534 RepID=A0A1A6B373_9CLOT|nr:hypothetical protein [Clostridium ragsdalei]OBR96730.1 hypothetical protein CLRAG_02380 [Clostridium ragsdalei P11]